VGRKGWKRVASEERWEGGVGPFNLVQTQPPFYIRCKGELSL